MYPLKNESLTLDEIAHHASRYPILDDEELRRQFLFQELLKGKFDEAIPENGMRSLEAIRNIIGWSQHPGVIFRDPVTKRLHHQLDKGSNDPYLWLHGQSERRNHPAEHNDPYIINAPYDIETCAEHPLMNVLDQLHQNPIPLSAFDPECINRIMGKVELRKGDYLRYCKNNGYEDYAFWHTKGRISWRGSAAYELCRTYFDHLPPNTALSKAEIFARLKDKVKTITNTELKSAWEEFAPAHMKAPGRRRNRKK